MQPDEIEAEIVSVVTGALTDAQYVVTGIRSNLLRVVSPSGGVAQVRVTWLASETVAERR